MATVVLASRTAAGGGADAHPPVAAFQNAHLVLAAVSVVAAALAFTMADRDARNAARTMPQREIANAWKLLGKTGVPSIGGADEDLMTSRELEPFRCHPGRRSPQMRTSAALRQFGTRTIQTWPVANVIGSPSLVVKPVADSAVFRSHATSYDLPSRRTTAEPDPTVALNGEVFPPRSRKREGCTSTSCRITVAAPSRSPEAARAGALSMLTSHSSRSAAQVKVNRADGYDTLRSLTGIPPGGGAAKRSPMSSAAFAPVEARGIFPGRR